MIRTRLFLTCCALVAAACDSITESDLRWALEPGVVNFYEEPIVVDHPDTVSAGEPFVVTVRTYGGGCVRQGPTRVSVVGMTATVEPLDSVVTTEGIACTDELRLFDHRGPVAFESTGTARILVVGTRLPGETPFSTERAVAVR